MSTEGRMFFFLHKCLRGIHLLKSIFSCMLEMVRKAFRNAANSHLLLPPPCPFPSGCPSSEEMQREGKLLLLPWRVTDTRGSCRLPGTVSGRRFQRHLLLAAPIGRVHVWLSALLEKNVNICVFYQTDQAPNAQQVGEEMREDRKKIDSETSKQ